MFGLCRGKQKVGKSKDYCVQRKTETPLIAGISEFVLLGYPDSNQERQDQNLQCYHYTIPQ